MQLVICAVEPGAERIARHIDSHHGWSDGTGQRFQPCANLGTGQDLHLSRCSLFVLMTARVCVACLLYSHIITDCTVLRDSTCDTPPTVSHYELFRLYDSTFVPASRWHHHESVLVTVVQGGTGGYSCTIVHVYQCVGNLTKDLKQHIL